MKNKIFDIGILALFLALGSFSFYKWFSSNLIAENILVMTKGKIVEVSHGGDNNKDIIIRIDTHPELFRFLGRFPKYEEAELALRVDSTVCIWHSPKPGKMYMICRMEKNDKTILSYADLAESYNKDMKKVFYGSIMWSVAFIVALIRYIVNQRKLRANQSLKLTEVAVDDLTRAQQTATIGRDVPRADWIPSLRHFVAAA
jgi:hypothetical protein